MIPPPALLRVFTICPDRPYTVCHEPRTHNAKPVVHLFINRYQSLSSSMVMRRVMYPSFEYHATNSGQIASRVLSNISEVSVIVMFPQYPEQAGPVQHDCHFVERKE